MTPLAAELLTRVSPGPHSRVETVAAERPVSGVLLAERVSAAVAWGAEPVEPVAAELRSAARRVDQIAAATLPVQVLSFSGSERT